MSTAEIQLGRVEGIRLVRNPVVWASLVLTGWWAWEIRPSAGRPESTGIDPYWLLIGYGLVLPAFVLYALVVLAVLRSRSSRSDELLDTLPVGNDRRTVGHGLSALAGLTLGALVITACLVYLRPGRIIGTTTDTIPHGVPIPRPSAAQLVQGPLAVVVFSALGLAFARWLPTWLVIVAMLVPAGMQFLFFGIWNAAGVRPSNWWWPLSSGMVVGDWVGCGSRDAMCDLELSGFDRTTPWWHAAYLIALASLLVIVAVLRHRRDRTTWTAFGVSCGAVVALAVLQGVVFERYVPLAGR